MTLRVFDDAGNMAETSARIVTYEDLPDNDAIPAPQSVNAECSDGVMTVDWADEHYRAKYILFRINGVDLDYSPAEERTKTIDEIEHSDDIVLEAAWMDEYFEVGKQARVDVACTESSGTGIEPVPTGIDQGFPALWALIALPVAICYAIKKYLPH